MLDFKKFSGKVGDIKKDYGVNINSVITKNQEIDDTDLDGEKVMMNLDKGQYFMMNEVGSRIWELIEGNTPIVNIIETLTSFEQLMLVPNIYFPMVYDKILFLLF